MIYFTAIYLLYRSAFWSFVVTGSSVSHEIKIWSCQDWSCVQTLTFQQPLDVQSHFTSLSSTVTSYDLSIRAKLDLSAAYLVLSDTTRKVKFSLWLIARFSNFTLIFTAVILCLSHIHLLRLFTLRKFYLCTYVGYY